MAMADNTADNMFPADDMFPADNMFPDYCEPDDNDLRHLMASPPPGSSSTLQQGPGDTVGATDSFELLFGALIERLVPGFQLTGRKLSGFQAAHDKLVKWLSLNEVECIAAFGGEIRKQREFCRRGLRRHFVPNSVVTSPAELIVLLLHLVEFHGATLEWWVSLGAVYKVTPDVEHLLGALLRRLLDKEICPKLRAVNFGELDVLLSEETWSTVIPALLASNVCFFYVCQANAAHVFKAYQDDPGKIERRKAFVRDKSCFCSKPDMMLHVMGDTMHGALALIR